ncbi:SDR family oxidoreductase [Asaia astilbis]|uniref:SDR family oxidoreductase n=1 Tax=Asaia astilbis TaxID=610244 RepID=UPI000472E19E|nr:SDR family oxidoreductase [Asaia astilbis]
MARTIEGKVVVITGASSGLGEAVARRLAAEGAKIVMGARRLERLEALADTLGFDRKAVVRTDVSDAAQVQALVDQAISLHGRIDVLINNAGLMPSSPLEKRDIAAWDRMIDVNLKGTLYGIAAVLPQMQRQKSGHIINVASVAGHKVRAGGAVYAATKTAVRILSEGLRQEVKAYNIRTTIISPGAVDTELTESVTDPETAQRMSTFYAQVAIPAESFADTVLFAMSQPESVDINEILYRPTAQEF